VSYPYEALTVAASNLTEVAQTERGTPVYLLGEEMPDELVPRASRRGIGVPPPDGDFAKFLTDRFPAPSCVIIRWHKYTRIFKLSERGDVFPVTARSIKPDDRKRLVDSGLLIKT
jgi:hypothetical protein